MLCYVCVVGLSVLMSVGIELSVWLVLGSGGWCSIMIGSLCLCVMLSLVLVVVLLLFLLMMMLMFVSVNSVCLLLSVNGLCVVMICVWVLLGCVLR